MDLNDLYSNNYVPYSNKPSVAVVRSKQGEWFAGARIENISYPLTISAVQNALLGCLSEGYQPETLFIDQSHEVMLASWVEELNIRTQSLEEESVPRQFSDPCLKQDTDILRQLKMLLKNAVVEQSNFPVSAIVVTEQGCYPGVNVECSSWSMGLCAERIAIAKALTFGANAIKELHIHTREGEFSSPCGACRQVMIEHLPNCQVHLHHADGSESFHFTNDLLPHSFRSSSLSKH